jgi:hypothetical protein
MADEVVKVKIKFDAKTGEIRRAIAELGVLQKRLNKLSSGRGTALGQRNLESVTKGWKRSFDFIDAGAKMAGKSLTKFLGMAIKGVIIEMAALGASMIAIHALFAAGNFLVKTYRSAMHMLAAGAAGAAVALASASAAIREQQAAIFAYRGKGAPAFGSAMNQTRMGMRNLQSDAALATLGVEALNKAYGNMSKSMNVAQINQSQGALKALMDFGSAGQDPAKGLEQVSIVIAALSDKKKGISDVITEAKKLGPEMEQALKKANVKTKKQFESLLMSGELAKKGGVTGQFDAVNNTLISQLKGYMTRVKGEFADFGDQFLEPLKVAFDKVFNVIRRDMQRILGAVMYSFGTQGVINNFSSAIEKASNWLVKMIRNYLPGAIGLFDKMGDWFSRFRRGWDMLLDRLRPLIEGAKVLYKAFEPVWEALKRGSDNLYLFKDLLVENKDTVVEFGNRIGKLIDSLSNFFMKTKKMFMDMLPFINDLVSGLTMVFDMIAGIFTAGAGKGFASALAPILGFSVLGRGMAGVKGKLMPKAGMTTQNMQVTATNVSVGMPGGPMTRNGTTLAGGPGPVPLPARYGTTALSSGGRGTYGSAYGGGSGSYAAPGMTMPMGVYPSRPLYSNIKDISRDNYARFGKSVKIGSRLNVKYSDIDTRRRDNYRDFKMTGRGLGYALFGQPADPYANPTMRGPGGTTVPNPNYNLLKSARFRAEQSLRGRSMDELHSIATGRGITGLTPKTDREQIIQKVLRTKGAVSQYKNEPRPVGIGQGIANDARRVKLAGSRGLQEVKYGMKRAAGGYKGAMAYFNSAGFDREKGEFYDIAGQEAQLRARRDQIIAPPGGEKVGRLRTMAAKLDYKRGMNRVTRSQSKFGQAYNQKFAGSMTGRMGTSMGLGLMSQYAPEEMRGAMALGATVSQFDPRAGLAVAGIGGAMKAKGAMKGALSGAAGGASLGAMFGPQAAIAGAAIGLVFGGIMGAINKGKENMKQARAAVREQFTSLYQTATSSAIGNMQMNKQRQERGESLVGATASFLTMGKTMSEKAQQARLDIISSLEAAGVVGEKQTDGSVKYDYHNRKQQTLDAYFRTQSAKGLTADQKKAMRAAGGTTIDEIFKEGGLRDDYAKIDAVNAKRLDALSRATGKSTAELELLAQTMGVNLYDATLDYDTLLGKFTKNLKKNKDQLNAAITDIFLAGANPFKKDREQKEAQQALNQNMRQVGDVLRGKGSEATKMGAVNAGMEQVFSQILAASGGDAFKAFGAFNEMFGQGADKGIFGKNQEFEGMSQFFLNNPLFQQAQQQINTGVAAEAGTQIRGILADRGMTVDTKRLEGAIASMSPEDKDKFLKQLSAYGQRPAAGANAAGFRLSPLEEALNSEDPAAALAALNPAFQGLTVGQQDKTELNKLVNATGDIATALDNFNKAVKDAFTGPAAGPDWWTKGLKYNSQTGELKPPDSGDTSTSRAGRIGDTSTSKLSQTMARHAAMNGQLTGKRTITSSLRNYALGSPSSDHATGAAYDLIGQNLGQYAKLVHANGGFAEFHGSMANRHLHVVPGPGIGDTTSMRPVSAVSSGGGNTTNYYSFEINGTNQSPEAIANMVIAKIEAKERSNKERR